ncbi:hypothetical protein LguiA_022169 [Lonicera macranthoides]
MVCAKATHCGISMGETSLVNQVLHASQPGTSTSIVEDIHKSYFPLLDDLVNDACEMFTRESSPSTLNSKRNGEAYASSEVSNDPQTHKCKKYQRLHRLTMEPLHPTTNASCHTTMFVLLKLNDLKTQFNLSDGATGGILGLLKELLPEGNNLTATSLYAMEYFSKKGEGTHKRNLEAYLDEEFDDSTGQLPLIVKVQDKGILALADGPLHRVTSYKKFICNGYTFTTSAYEENRNVQSSGVSMKAFNNKGVLTTYYGIIREIMDLNYNDFTHTVFYCDWVVVDANSACRVNPTSKLINMAREAYLSQKGKQFTFDRCYQILKHHKKYDLSTTSQNTQRSRFGPEHGGSSSINLCDDSSLIDIESPGDRPIERKAEKLAKKKNQAEALATA